MYKAMPTFPTSDLRSRQPEVFEQIRTTPVHLTHRGHSAGILVHPRAWNYLIEIFEQAKAAGLLDIDPATIRDWEDEPEPTSNGAAAHVAEANRT
jgi:hypothetical protein